jgi:hypothetical protein
VLEPVDSAVSNTAVRKDVWVRIPPAAPVPHILEFDCRASPPDLALCVDRRDVGPSYAYLLGIYLGDGHLTLARRRVWRLRVSLDSEYPEIIDRCAAAMTDLSGRVTGRILRPGCFEIYNNWKHWLCLLPQHGPGPKHRRLIALEPWQQSIVAVYPGELLRGLIHSDGCRTINRIAHFRNDEIRRYEYVRYFFSNRSPEIRQIFVDACRAIGVEARPNNWFSISVAQRKSVAILEELVGPKR